MDLWIRSQDKEKLVKCNDIAMKQVVYCYSLVGYFDKNTEYETLGTYTTKKRALEVLDEIQNILKPIIKIKYEYDDSQPIMNGEWLKSLKEESKIEELSTYVYEMPKE